MQQDESDELPGLNFGKKMLTGTATDATDATIDGRGDTPGRDTATDIDTGQAQAQA